MYDTDIAEEIAANNAAYNRRVEAIRGDATLSAKGRAAALAREHDKAEAAHARLIARNKDAVERHVASLRAQAFGTSELTSLQRDSFRAALAAATAAPSLKHLAAAAKITEDDVLLRAVTTAAAARGDAEVLSDLSESNPALGEYLNAWRALHQPTAQESLREGIALAGPPPLT